MQVFLKFVSNPVYSGQPYLGKYMPSSFIKFLFVSFEDDENLSDYNKMISQNSKKKKKKTFEIKFHDFVLEPLSTVQEIQN